MAIKQIAAQGTLLDVMNSRGPDGNHLAVAEILNKATPIMLTAKWKEANNFTQHTFNRRYSLPTSNKIEYNKGASSSLGSTQNEIITLMGRENTPYVDARLVKIAANPQAYLRENMDAAVEGIGEDIETDLIYGSIAGGNEYNGLSVRMNTLSDANVYGNGDTGSNLSSIYMVAWNFTKGAFLAFPKGTHAGIKFEDLGTRMKDVLDNGVQKTMKVHEMHIEATLGLCIVDNRAIGRICNIDTGTLTASTFDENLLIELLNELPMNTRADAHLYAPRKVKSAMDIRANAKANANYSSTNAFGEPVLTLFGVPVHLDEMVSQSETQVV